MSKQEKNPEKGPFKPHPALGELNEMITEAELSGGAHLEKLPDGARLEVLTQDNRYIVEKRGSDYYISGHPEYCPEPTKVVWIGSVWGKSTSIMNNFIGRGMRLEFRLPWQENKMIEGTDQVSQPFIITSTIEDVRELPRPSDEEVLNKYEKEMEEDQK